MSEGNNKRLYKFYTMFNQVFAVPHLFNVAADGVRHVL